MLPPEPRALAGGAGPRAVLEGSCGRDGAGRAVGVSHHFPRSSGLRPCLGPSLLWPVGLQQPRPPQALRCPAPCARRLHGVTKTGPSGIAYTTEIGKRCKSSFSLCAERAVEHSLAHLCLGPSIFRPASCFLSFHPCNLPPRPGGRGRGSGVRPPPGARSPGDRPLGLGLSWASGKGQPSATQRPRLFSTGVVSGSWSVGPAPSRAPAT